jgi:pyruvyl transferase EpsI
MKIPIPLLWKLAIVAARSPRVPPPAFPAQGPRLIVALAADYGNLGDVALTRALLEFVAVHAPNHVPYLLTAGRIFSELRGVANGAGSSDIVALIGGGNMGNLYPDLEDARLRTIRAFPHNRIVSFPQSIDFSLNSAGRQAIRRSRRVYEKHENLVVFARDNRSFENMCSWFPDANVKLAPDTVLGMKAPEVVTRDVDVLLCLRDDRESALMKTQRSEIQSRLRETNSTVLVMDTQVKGNRLSYPEYNSLLEALLRDFARARCIVTDRLHGLIFSIITETPCVFIDNSNGKISALAETWMRNTASIKQVTNSSGIEIADKVAALQSVPAERPTFGNHWQPLIASLRGES